MAPVEIPASVAKVCLSRSAPDALALPLIVYRDSRARPCFVRSRNVLLIACPYGFCSRSGFTSDDYVVYTPGISQPHRWEITPERLAVRIQRCIALSRSTTRSALQLVYPYQRAPMAHFDYPIDTGTSVADTR